MVVLINFADGRYRKTQKFNTWSARHIGHVDKVVEYSPSDIDTAFYEENKSILDIKRGSGLWLWKPYFIYRQLNELENGDILFYSDSGAFFVHSINSMIQSMGEEDIWLSGLPLVEWQFTKRETLERLNAMSDEYRNTNQFSGTFMIFKVGPAARKFVKDWLDQCCDYSLISPSTGDEDKGFFSHREDQSIISILAKKNNLTMHKDPSQYGKLPEKYKRIECEFIPYIHDDPYGVSIIHHRNADLKLSILIKQLLCGILPRKIGLKLIKN